MGYGSFHMMPQAGRDIPLLVPVGISICRYNAETLAWEIIPTTLEARYNWDDLCTDPRPDLVTPMHQDIYYFALPMDAYPYTVVAVSISPDTGLFQEPII